MAEQLSGSCLCGKVNFVIIGEFASFYLCHCERCRKDTGSAHASNIFLKSAELTLHKGKEFVRDYQLPHTQHRKSFCKTCGSALPYALDASHVVVLPAGSLDSTLNIKPDAHIFMSSKAPWSYHIEDYPCFEKLPL